MDFSDAQAQYLDNLDYDDTGSLAKARLFRAACRALLAMPVEHRQGRAGTRFDRAAIPEQLREVQRFLAERSPSSSPAPLYLDNTEFRA